jgi:hypothetical protein
MLYYAMLCYAMLWCTVLYYESSTYNTKWWTSAFLHRSCTRGLVVNRAGVWTKPMPLYHEPRLDLLTLVKEYCVENKGVLFSQCELTLYKNSGRRHTGRARVGTWLKCRSFSPRKWVGGATTSSHIKNAYSLETCASCGINPLNPNVLCVVKFNTQNILTLCRSIFCVDHKVKLLFPYTALTDYFITEIECVYCAVRTKYLYVTHVYFIQVNFTLLTVVSEYFSFLLSVLLYRCTLLVLIYALPFVGGLTGEAVETSKYPCCYRSLGALDRIALSLAL